MSNNIRIFNVEILDDADPNTDPKWIYYDGLGSKRDITGGSLDVDFSAGETIKVNGSVDPKLQGVKHTSAPIDVARLIVANKSSKKQVVTIGQDGGAFNVELRSSLSLTVNAVIDDSGDKQAEINMWITDDPIFSAKPVKPRGVTIDFPSKSDRIDIKDGESLQLNSDGGWYVGSRPVVEKNDDGTIKKVYKVYTGSGTLTVENAIGRAVTVKISNGPNTDEDIQHSEIEVPMLNNEAVELTFGKDFAGWIRVDAAQVEFFVDKP